MEPCQDPTRFEFWLELNKGVKAKHCRAMSTNFFFSVQYKTDTKKNMGFSVALLNGHKNSNFFTLPDLDKIPPKPF